MLNIESIFNCFDISDYDILGDIETKKFTENMDNIVFLTDNHLFINYLAAFFHNLEQFNILHGVYNTETYHLNLYITENHNSRCFTGITVAWKNYVKLFMKKDIEITFVKIYSRYCGELYSLDTIITYDKKEFYKWFISGLIEDKFNYDSDSDGD